MIDASNKQATVEIDENGTPHEFNLDRVFLGDAVTPHVSPPGSVLNLCPGPRFLQTQEEIFMDTGARIVSDVLEGYNGTIFAYGQVRSSSRMTNAIAVLV